MSLDQSAVRKKPLYSSRETLHIWMLILALLLTTALPPAIYSALFIAVVLFYLLPTSGGIDCRMRRMLTPLYLMAATGLFFVFNNALSDIGRDIWHFVKAISCMLLGYFVAQRVGRFSRLLRHFLFISLVLSLIYLVPFLAGTYTIGLDKSGGFAHASLATAIALPLLLIRRNGLVEIRSGYFRAFAILFVALAYAISLSRTALGCAVIMTLSAFGVFDNMKRLLSYALIFGVLVLALAKLLPTVEAGDISFAGKIGNSLTELAFTDDTDASAMLINWRGFEAYRAFVGFINSNPLQQLLGRGLGATVDLGASIQMSDEMSYQFIPVLHNGYLHVLAKYGLVGIVLYLVFLRRVSGQLHGPFKDKGQLMTRRMLIGLSIVLAYTTLVISGPFNKGNVDPLLIMLGVFFGYAANLKMPDVAQLSEHKRQYQRQRKKGI